MLSIFVSVHACSSAKCYVLRLCFGAHLQEAYRALVEWASTPSSAGTCDDLINLNPTVMGLAAYIPFKLYLS